MSFAVKVYAIADKYQVSQLQHLAVQRFKNVCHPKVDIDDFITAITLIDECTNPNDPTLWQIVLPAIKNNMSLLESDKFRELISEMKDLNFKLLALLDKSNSSSVDFPPYFATTPPPAEGPREIEDDDDDATGLPLAPRRGYAGRGRRLGGSTLF